MGAADLKFPLDLLHPRHWLTWLGVGALFLLAWMPWQVRHGLGRRLGDALRHLNPKRRHIVQANLQLCFPELAATELAARTQAHFRAYGCALLDYSILFFRSRRWLYRQVQLHGREHIEHALVSGQNVILLLGHSVWLEFAPLALGQHYRLYGSYKPFRNPVADWLIARSRLQDVEQVIPREAGLLKLVRALQPGRLLVFLADEDHGSEHSVFAPFFAAPKATLTTPARLAKLGKAVALPVFARFDATRGKYCIHVAAPLPAFGNRDAASDATAFNQVIAALVNRTPEQYMWTLKLFRTRPAGERPLY